MSPGRTGKGGEGEQSILGSVGWCCDGIKVSGLFAGAAAR